VKLICNIKFALFPSKKVKKANLNGFPEKMESHLVFLIIKIIFCYKIFSLIRLVTQH